MENEPNLEAKRKAPAVSAGLPSNEYRMVTRLRRPHGRLDGLAYALRLRARIDVEQRLIDDAPPAAGHARSNVTKQPNDAWSSSSTTWPDAYCVCRYARDCRSQSVCTDMPR
jgi:hypothetical protein